MSGIRNLTDTVQFKVFIPDITPEVAQRNVAWLMRLDLPHRSQFLGVVEIDHPFTLSAMIGPSPKKTVGYLYRVPMEENPEMKTLFVTSVFAGVSVPWPEIPLSLPEDGDLDCQYLGTTSHTGILLVHLATTVEGGKPEADKLEDEMKDVYLILRSREYDLDKKLLGLVQAQAKESLSTEGGKNARRDEAENR